ncbi:MAG: phage holin family protein [Pseudomonadales bacterium]|jgi:putative membrane protein|nr:phage holin family protein [Pseudomonadales bacterium]MDP6470551.1 phage holin family protein [Pseudomonadales bacterium]MDP6827853.1 phage holin family protein [Pseudomonadales bacterium]MDP6970558.1 phage holin family protein [Pseudomonadales bacterium]|tara:strand:- start:611 stop:985 length:375 start_codon:yes stop_codon:yes gene_type:complete
MIGFIIRMLIVAAGIWLADWMIPGINAETTGALLWAAFALGIINAIVRPVLVVLTFPLTLLTLGLFLLVINAAMLNLAAWFVDGFYVVGFIDSVFSAIIVSIVSWIGSSFIGPRGRYEVIVDRR